MGRINRIIRVFVSSTFQDMELERNILQDDVVPCLQNWCSERGWQFEVVDLRWGISEEASHAHRTMSICLEELRNCQYLSPKPNLLLLLGERYGWLPLPERLTQDEVKAIQSVANDKEGGLFNRLYRLNKNILPPSYELVLDASLKEECQIRDMMIRYFEQTGDNVFYYKHLVSATEQEIQQGLLSNTNLFRHVVTYIRTLKGLTEQQRSVFVDTSHLDKVYQLHSRVKSVVQEENCIERDFDFSAYKSEEYRKWFADKVTQHLEVLIGEEISAHNLDDYEEEHLRQQFVVDTKAGEYQNRGNEVDIIMRVLDKDNSSSFCVVRGDSGIGLTTFAAHICEKFVSTGSQFLIFRFVGLGRLSSSGLLILRTLLREVGVKFDEVDSVFDLIVRWRIYLEKPREKLFLILDGLDKLDLDDWFLQLQWLPTPLPPWLHVLITLSDGFTIPGLGRYAYDEYRLPELSDEKLLESFIQELRQQNRQVTESQTNVVKQTFNSIHSPLAKQPLVSLASHWTDNDNPQLYCSKLPDLMDVYLDELVTVNFHNKRFLGIALGLLCFCRHGIAEHELLEIAASDKEFQSFLQNNTHHQIVETATPKAPFIYWSRVHHDIGAFLVLRQSSKNVTYIIANREIQRCIELWLEKNFNGFQYEVTKLACDYFERNEGPRSFDERPFLLEKLMDVECLQKLIVSDNLMLGKCCNDMVDDLICDYDSFIRRHPDNKMVPEVRRRMQFIIGNRKVISSYVRYGGDIVTSLWKQHRINKETNNIIVSNEARARQTMFIPGPVQIAAYNSSSIFYCQTPPEGTSNMYLECFLLSRSTGLVVAFALIPFGWNTQSPDEAILTDDSKRVLLFSMDAKYYMIWDTETGEVHGGKKDDLVHMTMLPDGSIYYITDNELRTFNDGVVCGLDSRLSSYYKVTKRIYYDPLSNSLFIIPCDSFYYMVYNLNTHYSETFELRKRISYVICYDKATCSLFYRRGEEEKIYRLLLHSNINEEIRYQPQEYFAERQASLIGGKWFCFVNRMSNYMMCYNLVTGETIKSEESCNAQYITSSGTGCSYITHGCYELREWIIDD